jgi:hypothetical protein
VNRFPSSSVWHLKLRKEWFTARLSGLHHRCGIGELLPRHHLIGEGKRELVALLAPCKGSRVAPDPW